MQERINRGFPLFKLNRYGIALTGVALVAAIAGGMYLNRQAQISQQLSQNAATPLIVTTVTALGRLEPQGEIVKLAAATSTQENRISKLLVKEGDRVKAGQVIAILASRDRLQAALNQAQRDVQVVQARLAQVEAGAKTGAVGAQQAEITRLGANQSAAIASQRANVERLAAEVQNAQIEAQRYQSLSNQGAISNSQRDSKQLVLATAQRSLQQAEAELTRLETTMRPELDRAIATLDQISEVRPVDVDVLVAELDRAIASVQQAEANLEQTYVRAPQDGVVMDIHTRAGEVISSNGIVEIGQIDRMYAIAEVYQSDIQKIRIGQSVLCNSEAIPEKLKGTVERIDRKVRRQSVINTDPSKNIDDRVIEVHIKLDRASSQIAANFTNLQVQVEISQ
ncbi:MAG: ABC exporter membrane fusion protein [Pseudanabaena sp. M57BS1SP1A06MG]|nr:ABC exporter membrane fusion protein [Pseudanabaena sp. M53BS1SP1A06MG]MCA6583863.1 ABC exporter membrane fusion protein [Pseudanabaena sp. M34BS1SP1A06MG]MCA6593082.1 ABC exporter membrane fusion protein [Pseudanabaena sp. M38BS1SP1A06MG]MCA6601981.1 ABC exporter membrane fusion protein [Pseudanabaena sp. M57BS1SP1A06MG]